MEKLAGVIVLYNPEADTWKNIQTYLPYLGYLAIIDNSDQNNETKILTYLDDFAIEYIFVGENIGIAQALNIGCQKALSKNFDWLLTMDQDSYFEDQDFGDYIDCIKNFPNKDQVGMFGSLYNLPNTKKECSFTEVEHLITSGSILNLTFFNAIGSFDENLFIDGVDQEYCFRIIKNGLKVIRFDNVSFYHQLGDSSKLYRSLKSGKKTKRSLHSPIRLYYMLRNHLYLRKKYLPLFSNDLSETKKDIYVRIKNNFLYRNDRFLLLKYLLKAVRDYSNNKMGKIEL